MYIRFAVLNGKIGVHEKYGTAQYQEILGRGDSSSSRGLCSKYLHSLGIVADSKGGNGKTFGYSSNVYHFISSSSFYDRFNVLRKGMDN